MSFDHKILLFKVYSHLHQFLMIFLKKDWILMFIEPVFKIVFKIFLTLKVNLRFMCFNNLVNKWITIAYKDFFKYLI
jgi:hypothetical protein